MEVLTRLISRDMLEDVLLIQRECYKDELVERKETFANMMEVYPKGCIGAFIGNQLVGYIFFHPYFEDGGKALDSVLKLSGDEDCMYLHDIAVRRKHRGSGLSGFLLEEFNQDTVNKGFNVQCLVSVQSSHYFWERYGFKIIDMITGYGKGDAYYMKRRL
jgi:GNAT superfamily N-acetyltransferase